MKIETNKSLSCGSQQHLKLKIKTTKSCAKNGVSTTKTFRTITERKIKTENRITLKSIAIK